MTGRYEEPGPAREEVDAWSGPAVLEFGADWCGYCQAARPLVAEAMAEFPGVRHVKVADGKARPLGRSFTVKLWPTLIFLKDGKEVVRAVRPGDADEVRRGLAAIASGSND
jgi:thioredoxin 1